MREFLRRHWCCSMTDDMSTRKHSRRRSIDESWLCWMIESKHKHCSYTHKQTFSRLYLFQLNVLFKFLHIWVNVLWMFDFSWCYFWHEKGHQALFLSLSLSPSDNRTQTIIIINNITREWTQLNQRFACILHGCCYKIQTTGFRSNSLSLFFYHDNEWQSSLKQFQQITNWLFYFVWHLHAHKRKIKIFAFRQLYLGKKQRDEQNMGEGETKV